jgi:hypothetical protein
MLLGLVLVTITWANYAFSDPSTDNIASFASATTSYVSPWETLSAVNNNSDPSDSNDKSSGAYGNWNNPDSTQWVQYDWPQNYSLSSTEIYWFDDNGGVLVPTTAYIEYWDGNIWVDAGDVPLVEDAFNTLELDNIVTGRLRVSMRNTGESTGILEWRVYGTPADDGLDGDPADPGNIAPSATASTSYVSPWETLSAVNDDSDPSDSNDKSSGAYGNWNNPDSTQWVQYDWPQNYSLSSTEIYWFDDNGGVLVPTIAYIEYWNGDSWIDTGDVPLGKDAFNTLVLGNIETSRLRVSMQNTSESTGILEWRVYGTPVPEQEPEPEPEPDPNDNNDGTCEFPDPPANVAAWIDESWNAQLTNNITNREVWLLDSAIKGKGVINLCLRWGTDRPLTTDIRDKIAPAMQRWLNGWFKALGTYGCFPYPDGVTVNLTGMAVRPGQESLIEWSDNSIPIYTETDAEGEPMCPDSCSFFTNWSHEFPYCPEGEENHFDYSVWLNDSLSDGAGAVGGDWGIRMPVDNFVNSLDQSSNFVVQHEIGHGFGMQDYYDWTGSTPDGGSVMIVGTSSTITVGDTWLIRRVWKEQKSLRGW